MPFDGSGNFSRLYNWVNDAAGGIRILASRMDGEFNNFASGMNQVFFRNGLVPMSGNLAMGQNSVTGLAAGSVGAPSVRFADDPNTGVFLNGIGNYCVVANGATRLTVSAAGANVVGDVTANNFYCGNTGASGILAGSRVVYQTALTSIYAGGALIANFSASGLGLNTPLAVLQGGTGGTTQATARAGLGLGSASQNNTGDFQASLGFTPVNKIGDTVTGSIIAQRNSIADGIYYAFDNRGNGATTTPHIIGGLLGSAYRDVANPAYCAGIFFERVSQAGGLASGGNITFRTDPSGISTASSVPERMRIDSSGFVSIGTTATGLAQLHVAGSNVVRTGGSGVSDWAHFGYNGDAYVFGPAGVSVRFYTNGVSNAVLDTSGNFTANGNITALSDKRFKSNIRELTDSLEAVNLMRPVRYTDNRSGGDRIGFIAQDMQQIRPQYVLTDEKGYLSLAYGNVSADLVGAVQSLSQTVNKLLARIEVLEAR